MVSLNARYPESFGKVKWHEMRETEKEGNGETPCAKREKMPRSREVAAETANRKRFTSLRKSKNKDNLSPTRAIYENRKHYILKAILDLVQVP